MDGNLRNHETNLSFVEVLSYLAVMMEVTHVPSSPPLLGVHFVALGKRTWVTFLSSWMCKGTPVFQSDLKIKQTKKQTNNPL